MAKTSPRVLVSDFDGTMTRFDFYRQALARLVPPGMPDYWEDFLAGRITHFTALQRIFTQIQRPEAEVVAAVQAMELDPALADAVSLLHLAGWEVRVASAGCAWYIRRLLADAGVTLRIDANPGEYDPAHGLRMQLPVDSPYYSPTTGIDKTRLVQAVVDSGARVAVAGDGRPDLPALLLAQPQDRFARGWLAAHCREQGIPFHPFDRWSEIARVLVGESPRSDAES